MMAPVQGPTQRPGFSVAHILWLELMISFAVLAAVMVVLLPMAPDASDKARFTEVLLHFRPGQMALIERMALEGSLDGDSAQTDRAQAQPDVDATGRYTIVTRFVGDTLVMTGQRPGDGAPFSLSGAPSVIRGEPTGSVIWLCGNFGASPGWTGPVQGPGTDLPPAETPFVCDTRSGRTKS